MFLISIHAPRTGSDVTLPLFYGGRIFQSTLPARGATHFLFPPLVMVSISIHAPRTGSDYVGGQYYITYGNFNPRSPHGERRGNRRHHQAWGGNFNPRSPHGERLPALSSSGSTPNFNPRSPHGERHEILVCCATAVSISIHAPRTGSDAPFREANELDVLTFQSTLPARGATPDRPREGCAKAISIHAPRTGSDALENSSDKGS